ncbi:MAG TPA: S8 family serine peptidase, partial [Phycisphaerales bacterium]|nr:S8 family serine peptidase [Phycisphaerales bacterium]
VGAAITTALGTLGAGDIILIEQQAFGPGGNYVPCEWVVSIYNAIVVAVGNGVIVVEAAANGSQNLDAPVFATGNGGHWPFLPQNDSGAIMVGAGAAPAANLGSTTDRSRLWFSCYGSTVDLQGWGERVYTTGYGGLYALEGANLLYESDFGGTSSASPIVASACAVLQSTYRQATGTTLTPAQIRQFLRETGSPQQSGQYPATQNIGPRPDVLAAVALALGSPDCDSDGVGDVAEIAAGSMPDGDGNLVPDGCDCLPDYNHDGAINTTDITLYLSDWFTNVGGSGLSADANHDGVVNTADLSTFLAAWFAGVQSGC